MAAEPARARTNSVACVFLVTLAAALLFSPTPALASAGDFVPAPTSPEPVGSRPQSVAVGDFDSDAEPDLAVANQGDDDVTILLGKGSGDFTAAPTSPERVGSYPGAVAVGDFDSDDHLDLAVLNGLAGQAAPVDDNVTILLGNGKGNFTASPTSPEPAGESPSSLAVGDFDSDDNPDLAVTNAIIHSGEVPADPGTVTILLGDGDGGFTPAPTSPEPAGSIPRSVAVADLDGNGESDLAVANVSVFGLAPEVPYRPSVAILLGDGSGDFSPPATSPEPAGIDPAFVAVGDFDSDGHPDLAVGNLDIQTVTILLGRGSGDFTPAPTSPEPAAGEPRALAVGDFNSDRDPDLAVVGFGNVSILLGNGEGNFSPAPTSPEPVAGGPFSLAVGEFDGNRDPDLAVASHGPDFDGPGTVSILLGKPPPVIPPPVEPPPVTTPDTTPPETKITKHPRSRLATKKAKVRVKFRFKSNEAGSSFECKRDKKAWKPCSSPKRYKVRHGKHKFKVRAIDVAGNTDPTPAKDKFRVVGSARE